MICMCVCVRVCVCECVCVCVCVGVCVCVCVCFQNVLTTFFFWVLNITNSDICVHRSCIWKASPLLFSPFAELAKPSHPIWIHKKFDYIPHIWQYHLFVRSCFHTNMQECWRIFVTFTAPVGGYCNSIFNHSMPETMSLLKISKRTTNAFYYRIK